MSTAARKKLVVLGDSGVGKTALTLMFCEGRFVSKHEPTIEDSYLSALTVDAQRSRVEIVDTAGERQYESLKTAQMREAHGFLLCFSMTDRNSFLSIRRHYRDLLQTRGWYSRHPLAYGSVASTPLVKEGAGSKRGSLIDVGAVNSVATTAANTAAPSLASTRRNSRDYEAEQEINARSSPSASLPSLMMSTPIATSATTATVAAWNSSPLPSGRAAAMSAPALPSYSHSPTGAFAPVPCIIGREYENVAEELCIGMLLVGLKSDLADRDNVTHVMPNEVYELAQELHLDYVEVSAASQTDANDTFARLLRHCRKFNPRDCVCGAAEAARAHKPGSHRASKACTCYRICAICHKRFIWHEFGGEKHDFQPMPQSGDAQCACSIM